MTFGVFPWGAPAPVPTRPTFVADWVPTETPKVTRDYCPKCEPKTDPTVECLQVSWCDTHRPSVKGKDDGKLNDILNGAALHYSFNEAGGADNRAACAFFHRREDT